MSANNAQYMQLFGMICNDAVVMARCACVACNSCTCACPAVQFPNWRKSNGKYISVYAFL